MKLDSLLSYIRIAAAIIAVVTFVYKFIELQRYKSKNGRPLRPKWLSWYTTVEITGTSSSQRRIVMQRSNLTTTIIWICVLIMIAVSFIPVP